MPQPMTNRPAHYNTRYKDALSRREQDVIALVAQGHTNAEIAAALDIGFETAKTHVSGILLKLNVDSREEAARYWNYDHSLRGRIERTWAGIIGVLGGKAVTAAAAFAAIAVVMALGLAIVLSFRSSPEEAVQVEAPPPTPTPDLPLRVDRVVQLPSGVYSDFTIAGGAVWGREYGDADAAANDTLVRYDLATGAITEVAVGPMASTVIAQGNSIWTAGPWNDSLNEIDARTGVILRTIPLPVPQQERSFEYLLADETNLWVTARDFDTIFRISTVTGLIEAQTVSVRAPTRTTLAFGSLWVAMLKDASVARLDPQTLDVQAIVPLGLLGSDPACGACTHIAVESSGYMWAFSDTPVTFSKIDPVTNSLVEHFVLGGEGIDLFSSGALQTDENGDIWFVNIGGRTPIGEVLRFDVKTGAIAERLQLVTNPARLGVDHPPVSPWGLRVEPDAIWVSTLEKELIRLAR